MTYVTENKILYFSTKIFFPEIATNWDWKLRLYLTTVSKSKMPGGRWVFFLFSGKSVWVCTTVTHPIDLILRIHQHHMLNKCLLLFYLGVWDHKTSISLCTVLKVFALHQLQSFFDTSIWRPFQPGRINFRLKKSDGPQVNSVFKLGFYVLEINHNRHEYGVRIQMFNFRTRISPKGPKILCMCER